MHILLTQTEAHYGVVGQMVTEELAAWLVKQPKYGFVLTGTLWISDPIQFGESEHNIYMVLLTVSEGKGGGRFQFDTGNAVNENHLIDRVRQEYEARGE